jgi:hypothetical protein
MRGIARTIRRVEHAAERPVPAIDLGGTRIRATLSRSDRRVASHVAGRRGSRRAPVDPDASSIGLPSIVNDRTDDLVLATGSSAAATVAAEQGAPTA